MKYFSMFSGIGGFELGIQQAFTNKIKSKEQSKECVVSELGISTDTTNSNGNGWWSSPTCVGYSEIDKYAIATYERHFNGHRNFGDATTINPDELPDFDLLVGGFPCQAFSIAGKRKGFEDTRGTLFFDIARILANKRPRHLVLENVKGLLSHHDGKTYQTILGILTELGYHVEWQVLNSKDHGVPQNRERVYIVGHFGNECPGKVFPIIGNSQQTAQVAGYISSEDWPGRHEQIRRVYETDGAMPTIPTGTGGGVMTKIAVDMTRRETNGYRTKVENVSSTITATYSKRMGNAQRLAVKDGLRIRRLTPTECERLQGFPDGWTAGESDTQRYKQCGNAVTVNVVELVITKLLATCYN